MANMHGEIENLNLAITKLNETVDGLAYRMEPVRVTRHTTASPDSPVASDTEQRSYFGQQIVAATARVHHVTHRLNKLMEELDF